MEQVEPAVGLDVEDEVELALRLVREVVAHLQPGAVHEHVDAVARIECGGDRRRHLCGVGEVHLMPVRAAARFANRLDRVERGASALDPRQLALDELRGRTLAALPDPLGELALQPVAIGREASQVGVGGIGLGHEVEQVEGAPGGGRQIGGDGRDDAARRPGDAEDRVGSERSACVGLGRPLEEAHRPTQVLGVTDLDRARIAKRLLDQDLGERRRLAAGREVDRLDERVGTLSCEGLRESGHRTAHDRRRAGHVVAVASAEARAGDQEGAGGCHVLCEGAHRDRQQLHADAQSLAPAFGIERGEGRLRVEGRQPVDAVNRPGGLPVLDLALELGVVRGAVDAEHLDAELLEPRCERSRHTAGVRHQDHPDAGLERDAGRRAVLQRGPHDGHRHPAGELPRRRRRGADLGFLRVGRRRLLLLDGGLRPLVDEPDHVVEGRVVAQLQGVVEGDPVGLADGREHLRLLDRVDPQIRLEVEVHVQQIRRVTRLLGDDRQHPLLDLAGNAAARARAPGPARPGSRRPARAPPARRRIAR